MGTTPAKAASSTEVVYAWEGRDRSGKRIRGDMRAHGENQVKSALRRQGTTPIQIKRRRRHLGKPVKPKDLAIFTRQLATLLKAGVPLLQAFDIVGRSHANPQVAQLLHAIRCDVETGTTLSAAFRKHPMHFDKLYCNLVEAGEAAGILDQLLERLAMYMEKTESLKSKIRSALMYPLTVLVVALVVVAVIMVFVVPTFKQVFEGFGAELPAPTRTVIALSDFFVKYWYLIFGVVGGAVYSFLQSWKRNLKVQEFMDRLMRKLPVVGPLVERSCIARWTRTLSTLFEAGVPLVEALNSVGGAAGNIVYLHATRQIQHEVSTGTELTTAMGNTRLFPPMVLQMCAIGEESGSLDHMLGKCADFFEAEVDDLVAGLSSLMEPLIIVVLGTVIGGIVVAMYLPIFSMGQVV